MRVLLFSILGLVACGREQVEIDKRKPKVTIQDRSFSKYLERFTEETGVPTYDVTIGFSEINRGKIVGLCYYGEKRIEVDEEFWFGSDECVREELIYHELGHCSLGLGHNDNLIQLEDNSSIPESMMYPYVFCPGKFRNYYVKELKYNIIRNK